MNQKSLAENKEALANFGRVKRMLGCQGLTGVFPVNVEKHETQMQLRWWVKKPNGIGLKAMNIVKILGLSFDKKKSSDLRYGKVPLFDRQ